MSLLNRLKTLGWKIRIVDPQDIETEVLTDNVGDRHLCFKIREGRTYYVIVLGKDDAEGVMRMIVNEAGANGWDILGE